MGKTVITGASGYIGSVLSKKLPDAIQFDVDTWDINYCEKTFEDVTCLVHLAALVRVGESVRDPVNYYRTNVGGTINVLKSYPNAKMVFASTGAAFHPDSPYGHSKVMCEQIIKDTCKVNISSKQLI